MSITITTHLNFHGDARAALEFYQSVFGGRLTIATYGDFGMPADAPGADAVVFGQVESGDGGDSASGSGFRVMAYDVPWPEGAGLAGAGATNSAVAGAAAASTSVTHAAHTSTRRENGVTLTDQPFFVSVRGETLSEIEGYWAKLSAGASIIEPLAASAWSAGFGMLTDVFGVTWILDVAASAHRM